MKAAVASALALVVGWGALALVQLWVHPLSAEVFIKLSITAAVVVALVVLVALVVRECFTEQKLKDDGYLDG